MRRRGLKRSREEADFLFRRFGALNFSMVDNFNVQPAELGIKLVQVFRRHPFRQDVVDVIIGDVPMLLGQMQQRLNRLRQIRRLNRF